VWRKWRDASVVGAVTALCWHSAVLAQTVPPNAQPGRERELFTQPRPPQAQPRGPAVTLPSTVAPAGADKVKVVIRRVEVAGSTVYQQAELAKLYADLLAKPTTLATVYEIARRITAKYGEDGYVLSRAIVPPQEFEPKGAVVHIQVVEGWINKVRWPKQLSRYRDFFSEYAAKITSERPANIKTIERYLLLANDLPGLKFTTTLKPSDQPETSVLVVDVTEKPVDVLGRVDNRGTQARGPIQFLSTATINNVLGAHEALTLSYAGASPQTELQYVSGYYRHVLTSEGLTTFADASYSWGQPGTQPLRILDYITRSTVAEAGASYPLLRSRERNFTVSALAFLSDSYSDILEAPFNVDRLRGARGKLDGDFADTLQGINQINVTVSQGINGFGSTNNGNALASRASGRVDFSKIEATVSRTQPLGQSLSAFASLYGQYAGTSLLAPEQCGFGGRFFGRAYDPSELLGDHCIEGIGELRYDPPVTNPQLTQLQLYGFGDYGRLFVREPAVGTDPQSHGASVGAGLRTGFISHLASDLQIAKAVAGPRDDWRFFFSVTASY